MSTSRILIVDDDARVRGALRSLLSLRSDYSVCGEAADGIEAVESAKKLHPDVILMDVSMPRMDGLRAAESIRHDMPESEVILVSQNDPAVVARQAQNASVRGFVAKSNMVEELIPAIDRVMAQHNEKHRRSNGHQTVEREASAEARREIELQKQVMWRQAERATNLLAAIVDSSSDAIVSKNLDGVITSWNKGAERMFGYTAQEIVGKHITLIIPPDRLSEEDEILRRLRSGELVDHFETIRRRKDGTFLNVSLTISPVRDFSGRIIGASKVARDITEQKRTEDAYRNLAESLESEVRARTEEVRQQHAKVLRNSEQLRFLSRRMMEMQDNERRHIARELHDSAGQTLTVLGISLARLRQELGKRNGQAAKFAEEAEELARQLSREIRTTSYLLHPPLLDERGLEAALSWYVRGLMDRSGVDIELIIPEEFGRLSPDLELVIFRLVQECLTNIHRHSDSKTAVIELERQPGMMSLVIEDQGKGISPEKLAALQTDAPGVGIRGMRERVSQFGGQLEISSNGSGTRVVVTVPILANPEPAPESQDSSLQPTG